MDNIELFYSGTDFSPIYKNGINGKEYCFGFEIKSKSKKRFIELNNDKEKQLNILKAFLEALQSSANALILNSFLKDEDKTLYSYFNKTMYFDGFVGVASIKDFSYEGKIYDITLQINTRIDNEASKPFFLMSLLFDSFMPFRNAKVNSDKEALTDMLLLYSFVEKYKNAYMKGYYKNYHNIKSNDYKVKGSIDIARHIRQNVGINNGKVAYSYQEKSEFNYINHLIIAAYEKLKEKYGVQIGIAFKDSVKLHDSLETLKYIINYPQFSKKTLLAKTTRPLSHPFYTEYEDLRKICLKILREEKISLFNGNRNDKVDGVLMYAPELWEKYIAKKIKGLKFKSQCEIKVLNINSNDNYIQPTRPDFVFYDDSNPYMILDAKFKPDWIEVAKTGFIGNYLLSDYDKCIRDMVSINAIATGVIFPTNTEIEYLPNSFKCNNEEFEYAHNISKYNSSHKFFTFPIYVPSVALKTNDNFILWKKEFDKSCNKAFPEICCIIKKCSNKAKL